MLVILPHQLYNINILKKHLPKDLVYITFEGE